MVEMVELVKLGLGEQLDSMGSTDYAEIEASKVRKDRLAATGQMVMTGSRGDEDHKVRLANRDRKVSKVLLVQLVKYKT